MVTKENIDSIIFSYEVDEKDTSLNLVIYPFEYKDGRNPRLPRKRSNGYNLREDTNSLFKLALSKIKKSSFKSKKYSVTIIVFKGKDSLGSADLDNYSKAILDGITYTGKVWEDDKLVDEIVIKRIYSNEDKSKIIIEINKDINCQ